MSRYVDADEFWYSVLENVFHDATDEYWGIRQCLDETRTADVTEVKHEHWKGFTSSRFYGIDDYTGEPIYRDGVTYRCSNRMCNKGAVVKTPYCPYCGAKMDGEE